MFWVRLRSGILLLAAAIALLVIGGPLMCAGILLVSLTGMWELYRILGFEKKPLGFAGYASACLWFGLILAGHTEWHQAVLCLFLVAVMAIYVFTYPNTDAPQVMMAFFGMFYVAAMMSYMVQIRFLTGGAWLVWLVFISSWGCDTCAYCAGMLFGKHKMAPVLSPKKSVEGAIGGVLGSALIGLLYGYIFRAKLTVFGNPMLALFVIGAAGALVSMVGDLTASAIKRHYGIKDYGTLIPGHGGILDRFDSVIITAPLVYYLILLLQEIA